MKRHPLVIIFGPFFLVAILLLIIGSCSKTANSISAPYNAAFHDSIDAPRIRAFLAANASIDTFRFKGMRDSAQLYFKHVGPDSLHNKPTLDSGVIFNYTLKQLIHNPKTGKDSLSKVIDSVGVPGYTVSPLSETLPAISMGLVRIRRGERIILVVPSSLGFRDNPTDVTNNLLSGAQVTTTVQPNSILVFDIKLVKLSRNF